MQADDDYNRAFGIPKGKNVPAALKKRTSNEAQNVRSFGKAQFWMSPAALVIGRLRKTFGTAFVRLLEGFENMKRRFKRSLRQGEKSKRGGRIGRAAAAVGRLVLEGFARVMLPRVMSKLGECLDTGLQRQFDKFAQATGLADLSAKAAEAKETVASMGDDVMANAEAFYEKTIAPIEKKVIAIGKTLAALGKLVRLVKDLVDAARLGICLSSTASGPGAIIGCGISAIDKALSLFDLSPFDVLAAKLMRSCTSQKLVAEVLAKTHAVRTLPQFIARKIVSVLRDNLPKPLADLFCKPSEINMDELKASDFRCEPRIGGTRRQNNADKVFGTGGPGAPNKNTAPGGPGGKGKGAAGNGDDESSGSGQGKKGKTDGPSESQQSGPQLHSGKVENLKTLYMALTVLEGPDLTVDANVKNKTFSNVTLQMKFKGGWLPIKTGLIIHTKDWIVNGDGFRALEFTVDPEFVFHWTVPQDQAADLTLQPSIDPAQPNIGNVFLPDPNAEKDTEEKP